MKTETKTYFTILSVVLFMIIAAPMTAFATQQDEKENLTLHSNQENVDHHALAYHHEDLAKGMQAKIQEQIEAFNNKPRSSFLGRNGQHIKKHVVYKIREYEKTAQAHMKKAAYHSHMAAEQLYHDSIAKSKNTGNEIDL
ncbi:hypothetical protein [Nitrosomonas aestuarii]|uniref:hypothetical protein n=1 Tax=Nitrosomonas aestuarii TaxID=52441 RepID=UPI000D310465|nr:hypothetical protein [Nitrosomonas aestuarii]PTN11935.1 hypothetical protein C8R11_10671 [Nitrosomonas aestuarii]